MDIILLMNDMVYAVAADSGLNGWCNITYGRDVTVYKNVDIRELPSPDECPYVVFVPESKSVGREVTEKETVIRVLCCLHDEESVAGPLENIVEYSGVDRVETFRKYVETAIAGVDIGNASLKEIDIGYETIEVFPFFEAVMMITFTEQWVTGSDPLE